MSRPRATRIHALPEGLDGLVEASLAEGHALVRRLRDDWRTGANRFDRPGEALFAVREGGGLLGVCGLNRDSYTIDPAIGRLRHLYVAPTARRRGIGRALVEATLIHAASHFRVVRLRTRSPEADLFYRALGFASETRDPHATHLLRAPLAPQVEIVPFESETHAAECTAVLAALPGWFGQPASNAEYLRGLAELPAFVALHGDRVAGFASLRLHDVRRAEIEVLAVRPEWHRRGVGRALLTHIEDWLQSRNAEILGVKTLGPSRPDPFYAGTRAFYRALGFRAVLETTEPWGPDNPALILVKLLG